MLKPRLKQWAEWQTLPDEGIIVITEAALPRCTSIAIF